MRAEAVPEDASLVDRARFGDAEALRALLEAHHGALLARIRRQLHPALCAKIDPEDVLQEVYVVVARRVPAFAGHHDGAFVLWLTRIVDYKVREAARTFFDTARRDVRRERSHGGGQRGSAFRRTGPFPCPVALGEELEAQARRALGRMSGAHRCVLHLAQVEGTDLHQVAEVMGRSYDAVKKLHGRAIARLRILLQQE